MSEPETSGPDGAPETSKEPRKLKLTRPSPVVIDREIPTRAVRGVPSSLHVTWGCMILDPDGQVHACCPTSVSVEFVDEKTRAKVDTLQLRRGPGELHKLPAADLGDAAEELAECCLTMADVLELFTRIVAEGVQS